VADRSILDVSQSLTGTPAPVRHTFSSISYPIVSIIIFFYLFFAPAVSSLKNPSIVPQPIASHSGVHTQVILRNPYSFDCSRLPPYQHLIVRPCTLSLVNIFPFCTELLFCDVFKILARIGRSRNAHCPKCIQPRHIPRFFAVFFDFASTSLSFCELAIPPISSQTLRNQPQASRPSATPVSIFFDLTRTSPTLMELYRPSLTFRFARFPRSRRRRSST
jgi:hypothetical protein